MSDSIEPAPFPLGARPAYAMAVLTGLLYFLAFPGIDIWPLSLVALVPLILALRGQSVRRATGLGWLSGFTMTMTGFYWLLPMLRMFSGFGTPLCLVFMAILCAYQAGRIGLAGFLYARAEQRGWPAAPVFALAFVTSELLYPLLFPWYYAATVHNAPVFMQVADLGGPYLVALVLVAVNLAVAEIMRARIEGTPVARRVLVVGAASLGASLVYGLVRIAMVDARARAAESLTIGIVQGNQPLLAKPEAQRVHFARTRELQEKGAQLVIWSEGASASAHEESPGEDEVRRALTQRLGVPTIVGTALVTKSEPRRYFNTALLAGEGGKILGRYDKHYLLAFGEYLPFGDWFPILYTWSPNSAAFSKGTSVDPLVWGEHRISALICYEDILPGFVNAMVSHADPDLLVNLTNDAWFGDSTEPWIHLALAKLRAVEHRRYLVRATNSGVSAIVDPVGRVPVKSGTFTQEALIGKVGYMRGKTGYEVVGDLPWYVAAVVIFGMGVRRRRGEAA